MTKEEIAIKAQEQRALGSADDSAEDQGARYKLTICDVLGVEADHADKFSLQDLRSYARPSITAPFVLGIRNAHSCISQPARRSQRGINADLNRVNQRIHSQSPRAWETGDLLPQAYLSLRPRTTVSVHRVPATRSLVWFLNEPMLSRPTFRLCWNLPTE